jgi:hypothetical protein
MTTLYNNLIVCIQQPQANDVAVQLMECVICNLGREFIAGEDACFANPSCRNAFFFGLATARFAAGGECVSLHTL